MPKMLSALSEWIADRRVLVLGLGREGRSSLGILTAILDPGKLGAADAKDETAAGLDYPGVHFHCGPDYLESIHAYDIILKTPGIRSALLNGYRGVVTSQVDLFFRVFRQSCIGITGTKGKSTTASLLHHILTSSGKHSLLAGNIGIPIFDILPMMRSDSIVVCELSAHQLEMTGAVPALSLWLNVFPEHLDHFASLSDYIKAKAAIGLRQEVGDILLLPAGNGPMEEALSGCPSTKIQLPLAEEDSNADILLHEGSWCLPGIFEHRAFLSGGFQTLLPGKHNRMNSIGAAAIAGIVGCERPMIDRAVRSFRPLPHRLEEIGMIRGIRFVNDSISTIPQATLAALEAMPDTTILILGGFDRGIDFSILYHALQLAQLKAVILMGPAGKRMYREMRSGTFPKVQLHLVETMSQAVDVCLNNAREGDICLLSPAAASYDAYTGFEARGDDFRKCVSDQFSG